MHACDLRDTTIERTEFFNENLNGVHFDNSKIKSVVFADGTMDDTTFDGSTILNAGFASGTRISLKRCKMKRIQMCVCERILATWHKNIHSFHAGLLEGKK